MDDDGDEEIFFTRYPSAEQWKRPLYYAQKIRHLCWGYRMAPSSTLDVLGFSVPKLTSATPLFPNLVTLEIVCSEKTTLANFYLFLVPTLTFLELYDEDETSNLSRMIVAGLPDLCPHLKALTIIGLSAENSEAPPFFTQSLSRMESLSEFNFKPTSPAVLQSVALLPHLKELEFQIQDEDVSLDLRFPSFAAVTRVYIRACKPEQAVDFFLSLASTTLEQLDLVITPLGQETTMNWETLTATLPRFSSRLKFLKRLHLCITDSYNIPGGQPAEPLCIRQIILSSARHLQTLDIVSYSSTFRFQFDDQLLLELSQNAPNLQHLSLDKTGTSITLKGLIPLIANCPQLRKLSSYINVIRPNFQGESGISRLGNGICNPHMTVVNLGTSPIEEPALVAASLYALFPNLKMISGSYDPENTGRNRWDAAKECLLAIRAVKSWVE